MKKLISVCLATLMALTLMSSLAFATAPEPPFVPEFAAQWFNPEIDAFGRFTFQLDNEFRENMTKHLWFYMEFTGTFFEKEVVAEWDPSYSGPTMIDETFGVIGDVIPAQSWYFSSIDIIFPQPEWEQVIISTDPFDNFTITYAAMASQCVPEPASMLLLGSGLLGLVGFSKKKKQSLA